MSGTVRGASAVWYWALALALVGFGALAIFSIGAPFLVVGLALIALAPFRHRQRVFWPILSGVIVFFVGYVLVAPLGCTARAVQVEGSQTGEAVGQTTCTNVLGIDYSGAVGYTPPLWPALVAGVVLAVLVALLLWLWLNRRSDDEDVRPSTAS